MGGKGRGKGAKGEGCVMAFGWIDAPDAFRVLRSSSSRMLSLSYRIGPAVCRLSITLSTARVGRCLELHCAAELL